jgi:hypothetical protein
LASAEAETFVDRVPLIMPHPLESKLDESFHRKAPARRRSSLDNSNLSAEGAVKERLLVTIYGDEKRTQQHRRPSLSDGLTVPITFLADSNGATRPKVDLDWDLHTSAHSRTKASTTSAAYQTQSLLNRSTKSADTPASGSEHDKDWAMAGHANTTSFNPRRANATDSSDDESNYNSDLSSHSSDDDDSFCDASVMEQANEEYIKQDLGASCFWSDGPDDLADDELDFKDDDELQRNLVEIIAEEGLEEGMEAADAAALAEALKLLQTS